MRGELKKVTTERVGSRTVNFSNESRPQLDNANARNGLEAHVSLSQTYSIASTSAAWDRASRNTVSS